MPATEAVGHIFRNALEIFLASYVFGTNIRSFKSHSLNTDLAQELLLPFIQSVRIEKTPSENSSPEGRAQEFLLKSWRYGWVEMTAAFGILTKLPLIDPGRGISDWAIRREAHWQAFTCQLKY